MAKSTAAIQLTGTKQTEALMITEALAILIALGNEDERANEIKNLTRCTHNSVTFQFNESTLPDYRQYAELVAAFMRDRGWEVELKDHINVDATDTSAFED